ncbi:hypothetical protein [Alicyclobacillus fastidiosus]|uniref:Uncharacterized protein n=1 Tax=Alicyclobacillus fastidiosus TaxID=392011 RepID=A0ABV5AGH7_9BACL|nr:hypothetical protein [Alicyclobacillus fastidiosus]WEH07974.1 hypothetical protein PYS47_14570 [Alicyclobacillus fastidiosus]
MYVVGSFEHSLFVELVISEIEEAGVSQEQILAIPLDKRNEKPKLFDTAQYADGKSFLDLALVLGTIGMLLGAIYGFVLPLGPIIWALFGLVTGAWIGFIVKFIVIRRQANKQLQTGRGKTTEVVIMVNCPENRVKEIQHILWAHHAQAVGSLE